MALDTQHVALRTFVLSASLVVVFAGIKIASPIVVPFVLAIFIAVICSPIISFLKQYYVPKAIAILLIMTLIVLITIWFGGLVGRSVQAFTMSLPVYQESLKEDMIPLMQLASSYNLDLSQEHLFKSFEPQKMMSLVTNLLSGLGSLMTNFFLVLLTVVFILFEASEFPEKIHRALDDPDMRMQQVDEFLFSVNRYMAIKTLISLATGVIIGLGLWIIGVEYPVLWGVCAFLLNYIPNIGSMIAAVPAVLLAFIQMGGMAALVTGSLYVATNVVMGSMIEPRFMGRGLGLSTLVVFLSLIFWGWILGTAGMLLSVPLTMVVKIALEASDQGRGLSVLLSSSEEA